MSVQPFYRWYDLWVGCFVDRPHRRVYLCVLGVGLRFAWGQDGTR